MIGVLGSTGFVGTNLCKHLEDLGIKHVGGSRRTGVEANNIQSLLEWINLNGVTHVVNLAADCGGIGLNQKMPGYLWLATQQVSGAVLEAARIAKVAKLVMVGTVCSYAKDCVVPFKEDYLMHYGLPEPTNMAYGVAKLSALIGAQAYVKQYGMHICNLVPVNMYGPHDHFDLENSHVVPAVIRKIHEAKLNKSPSVTFWGTGSATREFLYVGDFVKACVAAVTKDTSPDFINIGTGKEISIKELTIQIAQQMDYDGQVVWDTSKPNGQPRRCLDVSRASQMLDFKASVELADGLRETIAWYLATYK